MKNRPFLLFFFLFFVLSFSAPAQGHYKPKETYSFTINNSNSTVKFDVMASKENFHAEPQLTYFWYSTSKILETRGGYDGKLLHGQYAVFYMNSNLKEKGKFKKGLKDGEWISWYENGKIMEITSWRKGLKNGSFRSFNETGQPVLEAEYKKGKLNGKTVTYVKGVQSDVRFYANDKELEPKHKKLNKVQSDGKALQTDAAHVEKKKSLKEHLASVFGKKSKDTPVKPAPEKSKKKNFFERIKDKFKKKDTNKDQTPKP